MRINDKNPQLDIKDKLIKALDANMIPYQVMSNNYHIRVYLDNGDIWNFYTTSQKYHRDGEPSVNKGIINFLNDIGVDSPKDKINIIIENAKIDKKTNKTILFKPKECNGNVFVPFDVVFSSPSKLEYEIMADSIKLKIKENTIITFDRDVDLIDKDNIEL